MLNFQETQQRLPRGDRVQRSLDRITESKAGPSETIIRAIYGGTEVPDLEDIVLSIKEHEENAHERGESWGYSETIRELEMTRRTASDGMRAIQGYAFDKFGDHLRRLHHFSLDEIRGIANEQINNVRPWIERRVTDHPAKIMDLLTLHSALLTSESKGVLTELDEIDPELDNSFYNLQALSYGAQGLVRDILDEIGSLDDKEAIQKIREDFSGAQALAEKYKVSIRVFSFDSRLIEKIGGLSAVLSSPRVRAANTRDIYEVTLSCALALSERGETDVLPILLESTDTLANATQWTLPKQRSHGQRKGVITSLHTIQTAAQTLSQDNDFIVEDGRIQQLPEPKAAGPKRAGCPAQYLRSYKATDEERIGEAFFESFIVTGAKAGIFNEESLRELQTKTKY